MSNPRELREVRRNADQALRTMREVEALPRRVGQRVRWSNGVIWIRAGDNDWRADGIPERSYSSAHVASGNWKPIATRDGAR